AAGEAEGGEADGSGRQHDAHARCGSGRHEDEPGQGDPGHLPAGRGDDLGSEEGTNRAVAKDAGFHYPASAGASRRRGIGENTSQTTPSSAPRTPIQSVVCRPIAVPSAPPRSAPIGRTPWFRK